jgi:hypothetical protein
MMACVAVPVNFSNKMVGVYADIDAGDMKVKFT